MKDVQRTKDTATKFLLALWGSDPANDEGRFVNVAAFSDDHKSFQTVPLADLRQAPILDDYADKHQEHKRSVYYNINPLKRVPANGKASKDDVCDLVDIIAVDIDPEGDMTAAELAEWKTETRKKLEAHRPTALIDSGNGFWLFERLSRPVDHDEAKRMTNNLRYRLGGDKAATDVSRLSRMPMTINFPDVVKRRKGRKECHADVIIAPNGKTTDPAAPIFSDTPEQFLESLPLDDEWRQIAGKGSDKHADESSCRFAVLLKLLDADADDDQLLAFLRRDDLATTPKDHSKLAKKKWLEGEIARARGHIKKRDPWLAEFNDRYFVTMRAGKCCIGEEKGTHEPYAWTSVDSLEKYYRNRSIQAGVDGRAGKPVFRRIFPTWMEHPQRRTYSGLVLRPDLEPGELPDGTLNMWRGWPVTPKEGPTPYFDELVEKVICNGDPVSIRYLWCWLAHCTQFPARRAFIALVLRGMKGTGKGTLATTVGKLFGQHFLHVSNHEHVVGRFSGHLLDTLCLFADEALFAGDKKHEGVLKAIITEEALSIEPKHLPVENVPNRLKLIMASNERWVVPASLDERRFFVLDVSPCRREDLAWFSKLYEEVDSDAGRAAILHKLTTMDLSDFDIRDVPKTEGLREQQEQTLDAFELFWRDCLHAGHWGDPEGWQWERVPRPYLVDKFNAFRRNHPRRDGPRGEVEFGKRLSEVLPEGYPKRGCRMSWEVAREKFARGNPYVLPALEVCRKSFSEHLGWNIEWKAAEFIPKHKRDRDS